MPEQTTTIMEKNINSPEKLHDVGNEKEKRKILIATFYKPDPVMLAVTRLGPDKLILVYDKEPNAELTENLVFIKKALGNVLEIENVQTEAYDIVDVARKCVEIIDKQSKDDDIFVNITSGRKTRAIGLLFAAYARHDAVKRIAYNPEEDRKSIVWLPRLSFKLTESQKTLLEAIEKGNFTSITDLAEKLEKNDKLSTAMVYRAIGELEDLDFVVKEPKLELTDAGKIARL